MVTVPGIGLNIALQKLQEAANKANPANTPQTNGSSPPATDDSTLSPEAQQAQLIAQLLQAQNAGKATKDFWNKLTGLYQKTDVPGVSVLPGATAAKDKDGNISVTGPSGATVSFAPGSPQHQALGVDLSTKGAVGNGKYQFENGKQVSVSGLPNGQGVLFSVPVTPAGTPSGAAPAAQAGSTGAPQTAPQMGMNYAPSSN